MDYENVLGEHKFPTYEELKSGLLRLIDEGKISREDAARLLPELRESEDEMIRKRIVLLVEQFAQGLNKAPMLAYLEKQKEQKPAWSEEDEKKIGRLRSVVNQLASYTDSLDVNGDYCEGDYAELDTWLKSFRPSWKPSEEDKEMKLKILKYLSTRCSVEQFEEVEGWLNNKLK